MDILCTMYRVRIFPVCLVVRCDRDGPAETRPDQTRPEAQTSRRHPRPCVSLKESSRAVDWLPFAPSMSKQDNNAPFPRGNEAYCTMHSLSTPNSTPPSAMTSSVQVVGFCQIPGPFAMYGGHVLPAWHAARLHLSSTSTHPLCVGCFHRLAGHAHAAKQVPRAPRLTLPYHWASCTLYR
ncbi:hypothetical protein LZ30DRAFT_466953 [Colletotrichum cereale]|nr:hypothetical protein LZ30DRAFT_466953 [Colletotrichum cereale]